MKELGIDLYLVVGLTANGWEEEEETQKVQKAKTSRFNPHFFFEMNIIYSMKIIETQLDAI